MRRELHSGKPVFDTLLGAAGPTRASAMRSLLIFVADPAEEPTGHVKRSNSVGGATGPSIF